MKSRVGLCVVTLGALVVTQPARVLALDFQWLRSENSNVREGNARLNAGDPKAALSAYDSAARQLPAEGGVHLDRGLALLRSGELGKAREALHQAVQPPASVAVRADAYYDLGIAFYREADARAGEDKHDEAQQLFREAVDAFKRALHYRPGDRNAAWNYELAKRRVSEQEAKQKQKQDEEKQKQDQQQKDQQQADNQDDQPKPGDQDKEQDKEQDKDKQDQQAQQPDAQKQEQQKQEQQKQEQQKQEQQKQEQQAQAPKPSQPDEQAKQQPAADRAPPEVARALDALEDGEQNLERVRALNRAARERRRPEKDW